MPLMRLSEVLRHEPQSEDSQEEFQIVVYADQEYRCGLVVNRIVDIVETELQFSASRGADDNLLGTSVIQQRVTDVLEPPPAWLGTPPLRNSSPKTSKP